MNKVAIIFGGTGGIGQATCSEFKKAGITVYLTTHKHGKNSTHTIFCDVTKNKDIRNLISYVLKKESTIDIVINSVTPPLKLKTIEDLSIKEFKQDIDTILIGGININKAVIKLMKAKHSGTIINILSSSVLGDAPARMATYVSAKYGLLGFTKSLAKELTPYNISVFGISPSYVETDLIKVFPEKLLDMVSHKRKSGRLIQPKEVANVILDIVQNSGKYKSGDNIQMT